MKIADLFAAVGVRVSKKEFAQAEGAIHGLGKSFQDVYKNAARTYGQSTGANIRRFTEQAETGKKSAISWGAAWKGALYMFGAAWAATHIVKKFATMSDAYNAAASRVRLLTDDTEQQARINEMLYKSAQETGSEFSDVAQLYQQVGKAAIDNGRSLEQGVAIVDTINKALKASGAGGEAGAQALRQLSQALGSGTLRGEEFNSVIEQAPYLLDIIAKDIGKTRGQMRKLAEGGQITAKMILGALERQKGAIDEAYGKRIPLISEQFARLKNEIEKTIGTMMQDKETADAFATAFKAVGVALIGLIKAFAATVRFFVRHSVVFYATLAGLTAALVAFTYASIAAWAAFLGPIALAAAAIVAFALYLDDFFVACFAGFIMLGELFDAFLEKLAQLPNYLRRGARAVSAFVREVGRGIESAIRGALERVVQFITDKVNWLIDRMNWVIGKLNGLPGVDIGAIGHVGQAATTQPRMFEPITRSSSAPPAVTIGPTTIQVTSNKADPVAVANETRAAMENHWNEQMRKARDTLPQ